MRPATKRNLRLAVLLTALAAAGVLVPIAWKSRHTPPPHATVAVNTPPAAAPESEAATDALPPAPPGAETVPAEESETDRSPNAASPGGPVLSFGRAAGLHLTPDPLRLNSSAALVVDRDSGEVLVQKNAQAVLPIASLTKLMTALIVLEARQPMDEVLTITEDDVDNERHSRSRLRVGTSLSRQEALHLALMSSENRAAHALGRNYPGGLAKAVEAMNAKARLLGMKDTSYADPTGLSNANKSTARDLSLLVKASSAQPLMAEYSTTPQHVATLGNKTLQYINSNRLVRNARSGWDIDLQKTGYIVEAGRCLTMATEVAGRHLIMVLLDAESNGARISDAERLRRLAVTKWGGPEALAALKAETTPRRKVATSAKKQARADKADDRPARKVVQAKGARPGKTAVAKKNGAKNESAKAVARKDAPKDGRVRQTFAAGKPASKS